MPGMAPPRGGPDEVLREGTTELPRCKEVSTAQEARAAVQMMAGKNLKSVKIWVDDRRGTYPKMTPEVYNAIIDEAHKHQMMVNAHATTLADQKAVVRAGIDVLVHTGARSSMTSSWRSSGRKSRTGRPSSGSAIAARCATTIRSSTSLFPRKRLRPFARPAADRNRQTPPPARKCSPAIFRE